MDTETTIFIRGSRQRIFELGCDIGAWPAILPHYRAVTILEQDPNGRRKVADMYALRDGFPVAGARFPCRWRCVQICEPERFRIVFKHLAGVTIGMWVTWDIEPDPEGRGQKVTIRHSLRYPVGALNGWFAQELIGKTFVDAIASRTLATIRGIVEAERPVDDGTNGQEAVS